MYVYQIRIPFTQFGIFLYKIKSVCTENSLFLNLNKICKRMVFSTIAILLLLENSIGPNWNLDWTLAENIFNWNLIWIIYYYLKINRIFFYLLYLLCFFPVISWHCKYLTFLDEILLLHKFWLFIQHVWSIYLRNIIIYYKSAYKSHPDICFLILVKSLHNILFTKHSLNINIGYFYSI